MVIRKDINVSTLNKIKKFLKKQKKPLTKRDIAKQTNVNYDSLKLALKMIKHKEKDGRISLK